MSKHCPDCGSTEDYRTHGVNCPGPTIHASPKGYAEVMPCCHLPPSECRGDRITTTPQFVTCGVDEPFVPDVDGNPIRPGQLVEACGEWNPPFIGARRVKKVEDSPGSRPSVSLPGAGWWSSRDVRALTDSDLFVPPEPETKTVSLHAVVTVPAWLHSDHYEGLLSEEGDSWADEVESVTVKIVSSTIHNKQGN